MNLWNYIVLLRPTRIGMLTDGPTPHEQEAVAGHFAYFSGLVADGKMLLAGRSSGSPEQVFGIGIFRAESPEEAETMMNQDPAVIHGVMTAEVQPFQVALFSENPHNK